ncbi:MAG: dimethylhistidine N-methyltransferase [Alphaproteobacteria bacterium]|nr:MAG: dimethylhistidine N-methyltransferase [Alphaproteobacteria bacterium]
MNKIENISFNQNINNEEKIISLLKNKKKSLPTQYLYDDLGSKLFEEICETEEYYLTRTEKQILELNASDIVNKVLPSEIFEFGSGSSKKTKTLIAKVLKRNKKLTYFSFDISIKALKMSYNELNKISKSLHVQLIKGDFNNDIKRIKKSKKNRLYLFLGSTLGNFNNKIAINFLDNIANLMNKDDSFLLGVDKVKDEKIINSAYNDSKGITKKFNKNILNVINKEYKLNFNEKNFLHNAKFNSEKSQIEMYLESTVNHSVKLPNDENLNIEKGEKILTEISRKFSEKTLRDLFSKANLEIKIVTQIIKNIFLCIY